MYCIIETTNGEGELEVSTVCSAWIKNERVFWPPAKNYMKLLKAGSMPNEDWPNKYKMLNENIREYIFLNILLRFS